MAIEDTLNAISTVQKFTRIKDEISTVLDVLSAVRDLGILLSTGGGGSAVLSIAEKITSAAFDSELGKTAALDLPLELFESVLRNTPRIAKSNLLSPAKDVKLARAFGASDATVLLYLPGVLGNIGRFSTGLKVAGRPLELTSQGGLALLGMGFAGAGLTASSFT